MPWSRGCSAVDRLTRRSPAPENRAGLAWWPLAGSNCRPFDFQSNALPTELSGRNRRRPGSCEQDDRADRATPTGLEPATSAVTGRRANQLRYGALELLKALLLSC